MIWRVNPAGKAGLLVAAAESRGPVAGQKTTSIVLERRAAPLAFRNRITALAFGTAQCRSLHGFARCTAALWTEAGIACSKSRTGWSGAKPCGSGV